MIDDTHEVVDVDANIDPIGFSVDISLATGISFVSSEFGAAAAVGMENKYEMNVLFSVCKQESCVFYSIFYYSSSLNFKIYSRLFVLSTLS